MEKEICDRFIQRIKHKDGNGEVTYEDNLRFKTIFKVSCLPTIGGKYKVSKTKQLETPDFRLFWSPSEQLLFLGGKDEAEKFYKETDSLFCINGKFNTSLGGEPDLQRI